MAVTLQQLARHPRPVEVVGGKAHHLASLVAAGLPVPDAVVVCAAEEVDAAVLEAVAALGEPLAVRSSSPLEDSPEHAAPGLFPSRVGVSAGDVEAAIAEVRAAAGSELARAYAEATGRALDTAMAVVIQRYIEPNVSGTAYSRAPGRPERLLIEPRGGELVELARLADPPERWAELVAAVRDAERAIDAPRGADVEWVEGAGGLWLVQARPLRPSPPLRRPPAELFEFARADRERRWRLDLRHNPEPLSVAQRGLVELVVARTGAGLALACGYLYEAIDSPPESAAERPLEALFFEDVEPAADERLSRLETSPPDLAAALDGYLDVHQLYGRVTAALARARRRCDRIPARTGTARAHAAALARDPRARETTRARAGQLAALEPRDFYGVYATVWDVAAPLIGDLAVSDQPAVTPAREAAAELAWLADLCAAIAELDDRLFYRAQYQVRRALLAIADRRGLGGDVFWLPLDEVRAGAPLADARARAASARAERDDCRSLSMPLEVRGDQRIERPPSTDRLTLRGRGFGGRASGQVALLSGFDRRVEPGAVVIAEDMTPADVIAARRAGAIALQSGSLLGHAAAMARELEIPIVVQIPGLCRLVSAGERVAIDGDRGLLLRGLG